MFWVARTNQDSRGAQVERLYGGRHESIRELADEVAHHGFRAAIQDISFAWKIGFPVSRRAGCYFDRNAFLLTKYRGSLLYRRRGAPGPINMQNGGSLGVGGETEEQEGSHWSRATHAVSPAVCIESASPVAPTRTSISPPHTATARSCARAAD